MNIFVEINIPSDYKLNWEAPKPISPKLNVFGWFEKEHPEKWGRCLSGYRGQNGWMENVRIQDFQEGTSVPNEIFVLAHCSGYYDGHKGGSSWYVNYAFIDRKNAEAFLEKNDCKFSYYWIVSASRRD